MSKLLQVIAPILTYRLLISVPLVLFACFLQAQSPAFYHLSTAEGLSDNNVNTAVRDRNGIVWIATTEGLNSFDGNRITTYHTYKYPELADNNIERIVIDDRNRVWVRTVTHWITMLDENRKFHKILVGDTSDASHVTTVFNTHRHGVIVLKGKQHYLQDKKNPGKFVKTSMPFDSLLSGSTGFTYYFDNDITVYYRDRNLVVVDYANLQVLMKMPFPGIQGVQPINDRELLAFTRKGDVFYRISIAESKVSREYRNIPDQFGLPVSGELRNATRIDENRFAFTSFFGGVYFLDLQKEELKNWRHDPVDHWSIGGNNAFNIRYDTSGYLFVTTQTSGLHFYNMRQQKANSKTYFIDARKEIFDGYIQSLTTDKEGNVWIGAQDRLIKWNRATDKTEYIPCQLPDGTSIIGNETFRVVHVDTKGQIWVGASRFGVLILDKNHRTIKQITDSVPGQRTRFPAAWINAIHEGPDGNIWVGTLRGTCIIDKNSFEVISLADHPLLNELSKIPCASLWMDDEQQMWIGTTRGAWCYNASAKTIKQYTTKEGLTHNTVNAVHNDVFGNIYFATHAGLTVMMKDGSLRNFNRSNGLKNDRCEELLRDKDGYIWIGNLSCLLKYDPLNNKFKVHEEGVGFHHAGFRIRSSHKTREGEMFWGTDKGILYFFPDQLSGVSLPLQPFIHSLQVGDRQISYTSPGESRFPYNAPSFVFNFSSGDLSGDKKIQMLYRLNGFDDDWINPATTGQAVYSKLPPGNYEFELKASRDGVNWFAAAYPVKVSVAKPWWQQTWVRVIGALIATGIVVFIWAYYRRRRKNRLEVMQLNLKIAESKLMNLRLQMNPHFLFNSLSSIQHLIVTQQANKAYKYLTVFSNLLRSLLDHAEKNFIPLDKELKILNMYIELESLRFDQSFSWDLQVDESLVNDEVLVPSLMVQPFTENAIWHGLLPKQGEKKLWVRFTNNSDEFLTCVVEDNGIGRAEAAKIRKNNISAKVNESKGIGIIKERLRLLEEKTGKPATLQIEDLVRENGEARGTRVTITIPYYNPDES